MVIVSGSVSLVKSNIKFIILFFFALFFIIYPVFAASDYTNEEWKEILSIGNNIDPYVGAELGLEITPSYYYQEKDSIITLTGTMKGIFGPFQDTGITIKKWNNTGSFIRKEVYTDKEGYFFLNDTLSEEGIYQYQAIFLNNTTPDNLLSSEILEISVSLDPDGFYQISDRNESSLNEFFNTTVNNSASGSDFISLTTSSTDFNPGVPINLTGRIFDENKKPISYSRVLLKLFSPEKEVHDGIVEGFTNASGYVSFNFSLAGPYPVICSLESPGKGNEPLVESQKIPLIPMNPGINPPVKEISNEEFIHLFFTSEFIPSHQNISIYGWYGEKQKNDPSFQELKLVWYNFGEKLWDTYQNSSSILTNCDGKFEYSFLAPETTGMYLFSVMRPGNTTKADLFSDVHAITIVPPENVTETTKEQVPILSISTGKSFIREYENLNLSLNYRYPDGTPVPEVPVIILESGNGIDWVPVSLEEKTDQGGQVVISLSPDTVGYHYYRAISGDDPLTLTSSDTLIIPVLSINGSGSSNTPAQ